MAVFQLQLEKVETCAGVLDRVVAGAGAGLDLAFEVALGKPFEGRLVGGPAGVVVEDGGVDDVWVGELHGGEVGDEGLADEDGVGVEEGGEVGLDVG